MKRQIPFDSVIFKEGNAFVAYCRELDVSSCGDSIEEARQNLMTAIRLFVAEARRTSASPKPPRKSKPSPTTNLKSNKSPTAGPPR